MFLVDNVDINQNRRIISVDRRKYNQGQTVFEVCGKTHIHARTRAHTHKCVRTCTKKSTINIQSFKWREYWLLSNFIFRTSFCETIVLWYCIIFCPSVSILYGLKAWLFIAVDRMGMNIFYPLISPYQICCGYLFEAPQHMFWWRTEKNIWLNSSFYYYNLSKILGSMITKHQKVYTTL